MKSSSILLILVVGFLSGKMSQAQIQKPKLGKPMAQNVKVLKRFNQMKPVGPKMQGTPDLIVKDMAINQQFGGVGVLIANRGLADAGPFEVLIECYVDGQTHTYTGFDLLAGLKLENGLPKGGEKWIVLNAYYAPKATSFRAVVDPTYSYNAPTIQGLKVAVKESQVNESNEDNNELTRQRAELKPMP